MVTLHGFTATPVVASKLAAAFMVLPSAVEIITSGILSAGEEVLVSCGIGSPALLAMMMPTAPAAIAFCALTEKVTTPRSISAILPETWAALVNAVLPLAGRA